MSQKPPNTDFVNLARKLVAYEAAESGSEDGAAFLVTEKLRLPVITLAGASGHRLLIARVLSLAKAKNPSLRSVTITPDGALNDLSTQSGEAGVAVIAQFLALMVVFVGEAWVRLILMKPWPGIPITKTQEWEEKSIYYEPSTKSHHQ